MYHRIGYTAGVFDLFHIGHLNLLQQARRECSHLIVGVTTDELSRRAKGKTPVIPFAERVRVVESIKYVDEVVAQDSMDKMAAWRDLRFDAVFVGDDWQGSASWDRLEQDFATVDVAIRYFPYTGHTSSTMLRDVLQRL
ncbi:adenylyltransferase/cytidyltransferase family protein [Geodermatophilus sp. DSM 44513]|uniref:adenylyltransferase/cytidyltransferase family protein n=1 Tax=Geodermatophilus sp. DSM 44513 TaxID=1528104 RepID=UPI00141287C1|nr:adenylyltransferase/cytidyltransferase family protein [Geodermatophilus sp. DSM 44513]WNV76406.1 adenylyltransferase/cytidyltransferase family protein [Geodermatophilus sp. DSM 44513]